jgi:hypothetical protein
MTRTPVELLARSFEETDGYDEMVVLRDIRLESTCEHHMAPILGKVHVAYLPSGRVVGISKLARVVDAYSQAAADPGEADGADRQHDPGRAEAARRRRGGGGRAPVHDHARRAQAGRDDGDEPHARRLPRRPEHAARVPRDDQRAAAAAWRADHLRSRACARG